MLAAKCHVYDANERCPSCDLKVFRASYKQKITIRTHDLTMLYIVNTRLRAASNCVSKKT